MKTKFFFAVSLLFISLASWAQYNFVVQNGTATSYRTIDEAYAAANEFDTIYLPGGSFNMPTIDKSLTWIGVGYHPDSTEATYYTRINNSVQFNGGADSTYLTGIHFASSVSFGTNGEDATDVQIFRCRIGSTLNLKYNDSQQVDLNMRISECIMDGAIDANLGSNNHIEKCIIRGTMYDFVSSTFDRIICTTSARNTSWGYSYSFNNATDCLIMNSVFNYYYYINYHIDAYNSMNNNYMNNIFAGNVTFPAGTNIGTNNYTGVDLSTIFAHIEEDNLPTFSYLHDFHLQDGCIAVGAGTQGTDIGIFGGTRPFKEGGLPVYPHIRNVDISTETTDGILHIEIEAVAQDK